MSSTNPFKGRVIQTEAPMRVIRRFTKRGGYPYRLLDGHRRSNAKNARSNLAAMRYALADVDLRNVAIH